MPRLAPPHLAGEELAERHVCVLVHGLDDFLAQVGPFIVEGIATGDREIHFVRSRGPWVERLRDLGVDVGAHVRSGQLEVRDWSDSYTRIEPFDRIEMMRYVREGLHEGVARGFPRTRWLATMEWIVERGTGVDDALAFEAQLDALLRVRRDVVLCAYDLDRHGANLIAGALDTHPLAVMSGTLRSRGPSRQLAARERILAAAHDHFHNFGIRGTGVDTLIQAADVAKATFYRYFPSKDDLIVAWLRDSRPRWFYGIRAQIELSKPRPPQVIPRLFALIADWLEEEGFRGCAFQNAAVELTDPAHPAWKVIREYLDEIHSYIADALRADGREETNDVAAELSVLAAGAIALSVARREKAPALAARRAAMALLGVSEGDP